MTKWFAPVLVMLLALRAPALANEPEALILPAPVSQKVHEGTLDSTGPFALKWTGYKDEILSRAGGRFLDSVNKGRTGKPIEVQVMVSSDDAGFLSVNAKEAYTLRITKAGIHLSADGPAGAMHGLASLRQLAGIGRLPVSEIVDSPRFRWRGIMIDVARHFMSIETLKRQIDAMQSVKLNVLHLHLSDNEGFRVASNTYPKLTDGQDGQFYSQAQMRDLVTYARDRGVRIVPEFDVPGHSLAIVKAYPELASGPVLDHNYLSAMNSALNPADPKVYLFIEQLFGEMSQLFPDAYFHVGGDEVKGGDWDTNPDIQSFKKKQGINSKGELQAYFMARVHAVLKKNGKIMIGWDEVADHPIPADVAVQVWRGSGLVDPITTAGNHVIVSAGYYLDLLQPASEHYLRDPIDPKMSRFSEADLKLMAQIPGMSSFFSPELIKRMQSAPAQLSPEQAAKVLGGEGALWSEIVTDEMLDGRLWPRSAALAERFWSPYKQRDLRSLSERLEVLQTQLEQEGLRASSNRQAMIRRIAPEAEGAVSDFLELVAPTRNHTRLKAVQALLRGQAPPGQSLQELADIATPDSFVVARFDRAVDAFLAGDRTKAHGLRKELERWSRIGDAFKSSAARNSALAPALPVAHDVASLSAAGLAALKALKAGKVLAPDESTAAKDLLDRQSKAEAASSSMLQGFVSSQPPADLLILPASSIAKLVTAAGKG